MDSRQEQGNDDVSKKRTSEEEQVEAIMSLQKLMAEKELTYQETLLKIELEYKEKLAAEKETTELEYKEKLAAEKEKLAAEKEKLAAEKEKTELEYKEKLAAEKEKLAAEKEKTELEFKEKLAVEKEKLAAEKEKAELEFKEKLAAEKEMREKYSLKRLITRPVTIDLKSWGSDSSQTQADNHKDATAELTQIELETWNLDMFSPQVLDVPSRFLQDYFLCTEENGERVHKFATEADISSLVMSALKDAIVLARDVSKEKLDIFHQASLFSQNPDHLVVFESTTNTPILLVEDKKPVQDELTKKSLVIGQIYDYLMAMRAFGKSAPFAVLTSFDKSFLLWQQNPESEKIAKYKDRDRVKQFLKGNEHLNGVAVDSNKSPSHRKVSDLDSNAEPLAKCVSFKQHENEHDRKLWCSSEHYESNDIVRLLFTAIICGLGIASRSARVKPTIPYRGDVLKLEVGDSINYCWGSLNVTFSRRSQFSTNCYYVTGILGMGSTSKVFLALDGCGCECLIKMFVNRLDGDNKIMNTKKFNEKGKKSTEREASALKLSYSFLKDKVYAKRINGLFCVVMPFFKPIAKEDRSKNEVVTGIEAALDNIYKKQNKKYKEDDIRWRHVGMYGNNVVLFDLADLIVIEKDELVEDVKKEHMRILQDRAGTEFEGKAYIHCNL